MKTVGHFLAAVFVLMPWCIAPLLSQHNTSNTGKKITITRRMVDTDGSETTETIVKKGKAAEDFDVEKYIAENRSEKVQIEVRIEDGSEQKKNQSVHSYGQGKSYAYSHNSGDECCAFLGVDQDSDEDPDEPGLVVEIVRGSAADQAGLRDNDMILKLNDTKTDRWSDLTKFVNNSKPGDRVKVTYRRNGKENTVEATLTTRDGVKDNDKEPYGFLGVSPEADDEDEPGITVSITKNSGADKAGLQDGDMILQLDDADIADFEDISDFMEYTKPGDKVRITYERDGKRNTAEATLGEQKSWDWNNWNTGNWNLNDLNIDIKEKEACLGVYSDVAVINNQKGSRISGFTSESAAREARMQQGDLVTAVNGERIQGQDDLWNEIAKYKVGDKVTVEYLRDNQPARVEATLKACQDQSRVEISDTDENGDNQSRRFFTWNWDNDERDRLRQSRVIVIRRAAEGDLPKVNATPSDPRQSEAGDRNLKPESFRAFPNPTQGQVTVEFKAEPVATVVTLYDMGGRQLFREELNAFDGQYSQQFDLAEYAKGTIVVHVQQGEKVFTEQIVVN